MANYLVGDLAQGKRAFHFSHDYTLHPETASRDRAKWFSKNVCFISRHPADVSVSWYRIKTNGMRKVPGRIPIEMTIEDWVRSKTYGLPFVVSFYNDWALMRHKVRSFLIVRYEDMHRDVYLQLCRFLAFCGRKYSPDEMRRAIDYASFQKRQKSELEGEALWEQPHRNVADPQARFYRKGKVGSWREEIPEELHGFVNEQIERLDPFYAYDGEA